MLKKAYQKFMQHHGAAALAFILFIGQLSASVACRGDYYQPQVPAQLLKK